jgi:hypothetical protein
MPTWWERGGEMPSLEERVAFLEGRFADDVAATADLRTSVNESRHETNSRFTELRHDMNARFTQVEASLDGLRSDMTARFAQVDARFAALDEKLDRQFSRLLGMQVAVLLAVVSALVGAYFR